MTEDMEATVSYWLRHNLYPPAPQSMVMPCMVAIMSALNEMWEYQIDLPSGVTYKGATSASAYAIIDQHYLWPMVEAMSTDIT